MTGVAIGVVFGLLSTTPPRPIKMQGRYLIAEGRSDEGQIEMTEVVESLTLVMCSLKSACQNPSQGFMIHCDS